MSITIDGQEVKETFRGLHDDENAKKTSMDVHARPDMSQDVVEEIDRLEEETGAIQFTEDEKHHVVPDVQTTKGIVSNVLSAADDPSAPTWTFRTFFLGIGIAIFSSVLGEIYYFKPQSLVVSAIFLIMLAYITGEFMAFVIPRKGFLKYLNPGPFNVKEHAAIQVIASTASASALGAEILVVQKLFYNSTISSGAAIFILFSSQLLGYGIVGLVRKGLVYPTDMFYPNILPNASIVQALHLDKSNVKKKLRVFYISFFFMFVYELLPEYIFQMLIGFSIPCLAAPNNATVSRLFGGTNGNEGLGLLSISVDWQYIAAVGNPMVVPIQATFNAIPGYFLCIVVFMGVYYGNLWEAQRFPFLSQQIFYGNSTTGNYFVYDQTAILDSNNVLNETALAVEGIPFMATTYVIYLIATNLSIGATFTYMYLFHRDKLAPAYLMFTPRYWTGTFDFKNYNWKFWKPNAVDSRLNRDGSVPDFCDDIHFRGMLKYKDVPLWWFMALLVGTIITALVCLYNVQSGLPWWAFFIAIILAWLFTSIQGGLVALFGFGGTQSQTVIQMIGSYLHPGNPMANMYFTLYGYNSNGQAYALMQDFKFAQYVKLPPRHLFAAQILGTFVGCIFNYIIMNQIVTNEAAILKSVEGTPIWSGQAPQQFNSQGIAWGALAKYLFSTGGRYWFVPVALAVGFFLPLPFYFAHRLYPRAGLQYVNVPILIWYMGWLCVGTNSPATSYFAIAIFSQFYIRKYHPVLFQEYNYLLSAGLSGGTQVLVFILSFAVDGAAGPAHNFPTWWGNYNKDSQGNPQNADRCLYIN